MLSVQHYTRNRRGLGEISQERSLELKRWCSTREKTFITEQLLRTGSTFLLLFREDGKTGLTTWLTAQVTEQSLQK